ncbi:DUF6541 family protein [Bifidobacterium parmae]|nr:DUF6541 family protein [Bifidobacterium parmae]
MRTQDRIIRWAPIVAGLLGVVAAFCIVLAWFPTAVWDKPIQGIDAPSHYYFIRKLLHHGPGVLLTLQPHDGFYPPLFHVLAALIVKVGGALGIPALAGNMAVIVAVNCVWILGAGILWPLGMLLLCRYFLRDASLGVRCALGLAVPILAVSSGTNPYQMLYAGPLLAYGLGSNLLPFLLLATLHLLDALSDMFEARAASARLWRPLALTALAGFVVASTQPKLIFTYILIMLPFVLVRMPWKLIAGVFAALAVGAVAFFVYAFTFIKSDKYFHPERWFHTHKPDMSLRTSLTYAFTDGMVSGDPANGLISFDVPTVAGWAMMILLIGALAVAGITLTGRCPIGHRTGAVPTVADDSDGPREPDRRTGKIALSLILSFLFVLFVFECSATFTGAIPNIVTAVWYRNEVRTMTFLPYVILPLIAFAAARLDAWIGADRADATAAATDAADAREAGSGATQARRRNRLTRGVAAAGAVLLAVAMVAAQADSPVKTEMRAALTDAARLDKVDPTEQLTGDKLDALTRVVDKVGTDALIVSDPLNGSMYGTAVLDANMLYPVYNPQDTIHGAIFGQVERDFASGDPATMLASPCSITPGRPVYFLAMGPQAPSLQMFTYRAQFYQFHDAKLIDAYVKAGALKPVTGLDLTTYGPHAKDWALYQLACPVK